MDLEKKLLILDRVNWRVEFTVVLIGWKEKFLIFTQKALKCHPKFLSLKNEWGSKHLYELLFTVVGAGRLNNKESVSNMSSHPLKSGRLTRACDELPLAKRIKFCTTILPHTHTQARSRVPHSVAFSLCWWTVRFCPLLLLLLLRSPLVPFTWTPRLSVSCHSPYQSQSCLVLFKSSSVHIILRRTRQELQLPWSWHRLPPPPAAGVILPDVISSTPTLAVPPHSAGTLSTCCLLIWGPACTWINKWLTLVQM